MPLLWNGAIGSVIASLEGVEYNDYLDRCTGREAFPLSF